MKKFTPLFFFCILFSFQTLRAQQSIQFALIEIDTIENFLMSQIEQMDSNDFRIQSLGEILVNIFKNDLNEIMRRLRGGCATLAQVKAYEKYLTDLQEKLVELEGLKIAIKENKKHRNRLSITKFLKTQLSDYGDLYQYQLVPKEGVLFQNKQNQNVTINLISFIANSDAFPKWIQEQKTSDESVAIFNLQILSIRHFFKNYKYGWVRKKWS